MFLLEQFKVILSIKFDQFRYFLVDWIFSEVKVGIFYFKEYLLLFLFKYKGLIELQNWKKVMLYLGCFLFCFFVCKDNYLGEK